MRVGFDGQIFSLQRYGGISRYFADLYRQLSTQEGVSPCFLFSKHSNEYLKDFSGLKMRSKLEQSLYYRWSRKMSAEIRIGSECDIYHATFYSGKPMKAKNSSRLVGSLFDMNPELFSIRYYKDNPHLNKLRWLQDSDLIISISNTAADELLELKPELGKRISTIHLYSSFSKDSEQRQPQALDCDNYILYVGARGEYKNSKVVLRALAQSKSEAVLVFAGGGRLTSDEEELIGSLKIKERVVQINATDSELWYLYIHARCVVVPSMSEGFSLPLVEGLSADVPLVVSDNKVHREVGKGYVHFLNPLLLDEWTDVLNSIEEIKKPSIMLGETNYEAAISYYSLERTGIEHAKAYASIQ